MTTDVTFSEGGFESPSTSSVYANPNSRAWNFNASSGVQRNGSSLKAAAAPEGNQTAYLQGSSSTLGSVGQWLFTTAGTYAVDFKLAARAGYAQQPLKLVVDGKQVGPSITPASTSFASFTSQQFTLGWGFHQFALVATSKTSGATTFVDDIDIDAVSTPYGGTAAAVPGTIQAERYDLGGEGVAYKDQTSGNGGGAFRNDAVDLGTTADAGGGYALVNTQADEWVKYTVNVATAGNYTVGFRVASALGNASFHLKSDGVAITDNVAVPNTGGWDKWTTVNATVKLSAGVHVLKLYFNASPASRNANVNWISVAPAAVAPAAPTNLATSIVAGNAARLGWADKSSNETGFEITRATDANFTANVVRATVGANVTTLDSAGLAAGTTYYFKVRAVNGTLASGDSNVSSIATPAAPPVAPAAPANLAATLTSGNVIRLSWTDNATNETGFELQRAADSAFTSGVATASVGANVTTIDVAGLAAGATYFFRIRAINAAQASAFSNVANAAIPRPVETARNLLFFGNSFTFLNDMPISLGQIAVADRHVQPYVVVEAGDSRTLGDQIDQINATPANNVNNLPAGQTWSNVIIQQFSTGATTKFGDPVQFRADATTIYNLTKANSPSVRPVLYATWAYLGTDTNLYGTPSWQYANPSEMTADIRANYDQAAAELNAAYPTANATVAHVGDFWDSLGNTPDLYGGYDTKHPSARGSLIAALTLYKTIYSENVSDIPWSAVSSYFEVRSISQADWTQMTNLVDGIPTAPAVAQSTLSTTQTTTKDNSAIASVLA